MKIDNFIYFLICIGILACQPSLDRQPKIKPYGVADFFTDQSSVRNPPASTVTFLKKTLPSPKITGLLLTEGQKKYDIYCSVCHGFSGHGNGMAVQRGFPAPVSFAQLQGLSTLAVFSIVSLGTMDMPTFSSKLTEQERWAVANYVKALQLREHFPNRLLSESDLQHLKETSP